MAGLVPVCSWQPADPETAPVFGSQTLFTLVGLELNQIVRHEISGV